MILSGALKQVKLQVTDQINLGHKAQESDLGNSTEEAWPRPTATSPVQTKHDPVLSTETQQLGKPGPHVYIETSSPEAQSNLGTLTN